MKKTKQTLSLLIIIAVIFGTLISPVYARGGETGEPDMEWYNFRNNQENNGITGRPTPIKADETWMRFAAKYGTGWGAAPTPPLILDGYLYVAVDRYIVKVDRKTGAEVARSDEMFGQVGFAMHPILYADGNFFVQVGNGVVQAVDYRTLKCKWHTPKIGGQTVSTIAHMKSGGKGYIYTGTWKGENGDGTYFCVTTDDENITPELDKGGNPTGRCVKEHLWDFTPKTDDKILAEDGDSKKRGFYWAGAYACENYIAMGSDDGTKEGDYTANAVFYTLDPKTGEIIDRIDKIKGDIRSNAVYDNGYLYFNTKGGMLYKVKTDDWGRFDHDSVQSLDLGGMTTATPIVYKNKIYLGVAGKGGQFDPDGGHRFAVVSNRGELKEIYSLPINGYPQAGALLSNFHEKEDYDGNGQPDGRIYLYFTYNAKPGGIYFTYDTPDGTGAPGEEGEIFVPEEKYQEHCISPIVVDREGTLYYKNDTCNILAVEINAAYLAGISVRTKGEDGAEKDAPMSSPFSAQISNYEAVVPGTDKAYLSLALPQGADAEVNGKSYDENMEIPLPENENPVRIVITQGEFSRVYHVSIRKESDSAALGELYVNDSNNPAAGHIVTVLPQLSPGFFRYTADMTDVPPKKFYNVWLKAADPTSQITGVEGKINVEKAEGFDLPSDKNKKRYAVYFTEPGKTAAIEITVKAETGKTNTYELTIFKKVSVEAVDIEGGDITLSVGDKIVMKADVSPADASFGGVTWSVSDPEIAVVDPETGDLTALKAGETTVTAASKDNVEIKASRRVTVKEAEPVIEAGWVDTEDGRKYQYPDGTWAAGKVEIDGRTYLFDEEGYLMHEETPDEPINPDRPINPDKPADPDKPASASDMPEPAGTEDKEKTDPHFPKTGDPDHPWIWLAAAALSAWGIQALSLKGKKKETR